MKINGINLLTNREYEDNKINSYEFFQKPTFLNIDKVKDEYTEGIDMSFGFLIKLEIISNTDIHPVHLERIKSFGLELYDVSFLDGVLSNEYIRLTFQHKHINELFK